MNNKYILLETLITKKVSVVLRPIWMKWEIKKEYS